MLAESKGLCSVEFCALSQLVQSTFARLLVLLRIHPKIVLWKAASRVRMVEGTITSIQNIHFWKRQQRVAMGILFAILRAYKFGPMQL
jgi:hypothetical protein